MIQGFDWLQSVNPLVDWVNYGVTLKTCFVVIGIPVYYNIKVELFSFKVLMHSLHANKLENSRITFV